MRLERERKVRGYSREVSEMGVRHGKWNARIFSKGKDAKKEDEGKGG